MKNNKIVQVFMNINMANSHDGLSKIAKDAGVKIKDIETGNFVVFINAKKTKMKLYAAGEVIAYLRMPQGDKINMNVIKELPRVFNGSKINYDLALKTVVENALAQKHGTTIKALI